MDDKDVLKLIGVASTVTIAFLIPTESMAAIPGEKIQRIECNGGVAEVVNTDQHGLNGSVFAVEAHIITGKDKKSGSQNAGYQAQTYGLKPPISRSGFKAAKVYYKFNSELTTDDNLVLSLFFKNAQGRFSISRFFSEVGTKSAGGGWRVLEFKSSQEAKQNLEQAKIERAAVTLAGGESKAEGEISVILGDITLETLQQGTAHPEFIKGQATCPGGFGDFGKGGGKEGA